MLLGARGFWRHRGLPAVHPAQSWRHQWCRCASSSSSSSVMPPLEVIDCHAAGEPARVVVRGLPPIPGSTMMEKRDHMRDHMDSVRKLLLLEPRGYPCQNADYVLPSTRPEAAFGFVIAEQNAIYPAMSGHNALCVATALLETGRVPMTEPRTRFTLEAPAGLIEFDAECRDGKVWC